MKRPDGLVFDVSHGCFHDGPGLRTVVFLKGCALSCPWCHNLEGVSRDPEIAFDARRCIDCGRCREVCPREWSPSGWREGCTACGRCAAACPARARRLVGRRLAVDELLAEIELGMRFFGGTGGGVTFSGGEPLLQSEFLFAGADALRARGIHVAVETSGYFAASLLPALQQRFDLVLHDLKHVDLERCREAIGTGSPLALENIAALITAGTPLRVRITIVPGFNDSEADLRAIGEWLVEHGAPSITLQGFHRLAVGKQELFGRSYRCAGLEPLPRARLAAAAELLRGMGLRVELT